jgi:hypothetical protein
MHELVHGAHAYMVMGLNPTPVIILLMLAIVNMLQINTVVIVDIIRHIILVGGGENLLLKYRVCQTCQT